MYRWPSCKFSDLLKQPLRNGIYKKKEFHGRGAKIINMGELFGYPRMGAIPMKRVELSGTEPDRFSVEKNDLLFARRSLVAEGAGKCSIVLDVDELTTFESSIIRARLNTNRAVPLFYYYYFASPQGLHNLDSIRRQVAVAGITGGDLAELVTPAPPPQEQRAVTSILGILDDKIELNRRMNETLEAMARAIFKDWFVDFGPTRAKAEGRAPYLAPEFWDLFPDALDSEGKPAGWETRRLEDFLELAYGKSLPAKNRIPGKIPVYGSGGLTGTHDTALIDGPAVVVGRKGTVGSLYWDDGPIFPIDTVFYVVPRIGSVLFSYHLLATQPLQNMNTDAAVPGLNRGNAYRLEFPQPQSELVSAFEEIAGALWQQRARALREVETLSHTRDLLLPKLMSGELRLREVMQAREAVT